MRKHLRTFLTAAVILMLAAGTGRLRTLAAEPHTDSHEAYENARKNYEETYRRILEKAAEESAGYAGMETGEKIYTVIRDSYLSFKQRYAVFVTAGLLMTGTAGFVLSRKNRLWQRTFLMIGLLCPAVMWIVLAVIGVTLG